MLLLWNLQKWKLFRELFWSKKKQQSEEERDQVFIMLSNEDRIYFIKDSFENIMKAQGDITKCSKDSVSWESKFTSGMSNGEPLNYIVKFSINKLE